MKVLITGFNGLGTSITKEFLNHNYDVCVTYNNSIEESLNNISNLEELYKKRINKFKLDLSNEKDITNLVDNCTDIDILINNASISLDNDLKDKTKEEFMKVLEVNVVGTFLLTRELIEKSNVKTIVNISSTDSIDTYNDYNIDYSVSKSSINLMTNIMSDYYKTKKIITVLPNWIDTNSVLEMEPKFLESELKRIGQKELLKKEDVSKKIYEVATDEKYKTKEMIRIG